MRLLFLNLLRQPLRTLLPVFGVGVALFLFCFLETVLTAFNAGVNMALMVQSDMATPIIDAIGSDEVKQTFLAPAIAGEQIAALGVTEPGVGSDVANLATTARSDGDDYVISGQKTFITNGTRADFITLAVRTGEAGFAGISVVVVPTDRPGYTGSCKLAKMGNLASATAQSFIDDVRVPERVPLCAGSAACYAAMTSVAADRLIAAHTAAAGRGRSRDSRCRGAGAGVVTARYDVSLRRRLSRFRASPPGVRRPGRLGRPRGTLCPLGPER